MSVSDIASGAAVLISLFALVRGEVLSRRIPSAKWEMSVHERHGHVWVTVRNDGPCDAWYPRVKHEQLPDGSVCAGTLSGPPCTYVGDAIEFGVEPVPASRIPGALLVEWYPSRFAFRHAFKRRVGAVSTEPWREAAAAS